VALTPRGRMVAVTAVAALAVATTLTVSHLSGGDSSAAAPPPVPTVVPTQAVEPTSVLPPSVTPSASPSASPQGEGEDSATSNVVVPHGDGKPVVVRGGTTRSGTGPLRTYTVAVEGGLGIDPTAFAAAVDATLADQRSWGAADRLSFQRVDSGAVSFKVVLASPALTDAMCAPLSTNGNLSCGNGSTAVLNAFRWQKGADAYVGDLPRYRQYVVNHEVGHTLGHGHAACTKAGAIAPVMMQQTKGVGSCVAQPWPFP
jgi:hypothetical protein